MTTLNETEIVALHEALEDEHHAWATYDQVIQDFGLVRPFSNIRDATVFRNLRDASQERHLPAFRRCVERRG